MLIRRIQYSISFIHIITFKEEYKNAILPYFGFEGLRYGIDNENTIDEGIRLIFEIEKFAIFFKKDGITIIYDGLASDLKSQNGVMKIFWEIYDRTKSFNGYKKATRHNLICHGVKLIDQNIYNSFLTQNPYFTANPFGTLDDYACIYEFKKDHKAYKFHIGNYSKEDVKKQELRPFNAEINNDLLLNESVGLMCRTEINEDISNASFSKFHDLLDETEKLILSYDLKL